MLSPGPMLLGWFKDGDSGEVRIGNLNKRHISTRNERRKWCSQLGHQGHPAFRAYHFSEGATKVKLRPAWNPCPDTITNVSSVQIKQICHTQSPPGPITSSSAFDMEAQHCYEWGCQFHACISVCIKKVETRVRWREDSCFKVIFPHCHKSPQDKIVSLLHITAHKQCKLTALHSFNIRFAFQHTQH